MCVWGTGIAYDIFTTDLCILLLWVCLVVLIISSHFQPQEGSGIKYLLEIFPDL